MTITITITLPCMTVHAEAGPEDGSGAAGSEVAVIEALRTALQCSQLAGDTAFNQIKALTGNWNPSAQKHRQDVVEQSSSIQVIDATTQHSETCSARWTWQ